MATKRCPECHMLHSGTAITCACGYNFKSSTMQLVTKKRPTSITVLAWFLIVGSGLSLIPSPFYLSDPRAKEIWDSMQIPISLVIPNLFIGSLVGVISGIGMLKGLNWARFLDVIWSSIVIVIGFATLSMKALVIPGIVLLMISIFILFRPKANEYFSSND